jgi:Ser/Thr protein kinase RdoA (MazF antagonist)
MMPISELVRLARSLDARHRCPLGDAAAARWGYPSALFVRSSASHVFASGPAAADQPRIVLRMRRDGEAAMAHAARSAAALHDAGAPVPRSLPSSRSRQVEHVDGYAVMALEVVEGDVLDSDEADEDTAWRWGRLLADFHLRGGTVGEAVPREASDTDAGLRALPRTPDVCGVLHGDPELDNVVWDGERGILVDLDDVHLGWFVSDVAFALRDWAPPAAAPDLSAPVPAAFLAGYRDRRPMTDEELSWLPLMARASAARTLVDLAPVLAESAAEEWPDWAHALDSRVRAHAADLRRALQHDGT